MSDQLRVIYDTTNLQATVHSNNCCYTTYVHGWCPPAASTVLSQVSVSPESKKSPVLPLPTPAKPRGSGRSPSINQSTNHTRNIVSRLLDPISPAKEAEKGKRKRGKRKKEYAPPPKAPIGCYEKARRKKKLQAPPPKSQKSNPPDMKKVYEGLSQ